MLAQANDRLQSERFAAQFFLFVFAGILQYEIQNVGSGLVIGAIITGDPGFGDEDLTELDPAF